MNSSFELEQNLSEILTNQSIYKSSQIEDSNSEATCLVRVSFNNYTNETKNDNFCSAVWDIFYCWPPTRAGIVVTKHCSDIFEALYPVLATHLDGHARRECLANGTWAEESISNYSECAKSIKSYLNGIGEDAFLVPMVHYMLFIGSILSLACLGVSLAIFFHFKCLQCDRVTVHVHLMLSLVLRFILIFVITEPFVIGHSGSFRDVEILCESVLVLFLFSTFTSVSWMFIQGLYLNVALMGSVITISTGCQLTIYYIIGWGVPVAFVLVYVISMIFKEQKTCWNGYSEMTEMWILMGPITFELVVNGMFLLNILRILLKKVKNSNARQDSSKLKAAAKATAILFPVLGINNLVLLYNPGGNYNKYFVTLNTFFGSTQGILVAIVYCFIDKEVHGAFRRSIKRRNTRRNVNLNRNQNIS